MGDFILLVLAAIITASVVFGVFAFTVGLDRGLTQPRPDGVPFDLPTDRPVEPRDLDRVRFDLTIRGYRMEQVDVVLDRFAHDLDLAIDRIAELEDELASVRAGAGDDDSYEVHGPDVDVGALPSPLTADVPVGFEPGAGIPAERVSGPDDPVPPGAETDGADTAAEVNTAGAPGVRARLRGA